MRYKNVVILLFRYYLCLRKPCRIPATVASNIHTYMYHRQYYIQSSCLHLASIVSKHLFIIPTDAHNYKIIGMLKTIKIPTVAPTCFGSCRNHHQGAISCIAKTTIMILLCSS